MRWFLSICLGFFLWVPSVFAYLTYDGVDDVVNCGSGSSIDNLTTMTFMAWVRTTQDSGRQTVYGKSDWTSFTALNFVLLDMAALRKRIEYQRLFSTSGGTWLSPNSSLAVNTWYHIAITHDATSASNVPAMYINGVSQTVTTDTAAVGNVKDDSASTFMFGQDTDPTSGFDMYAGDIEDACYCSTVLTAAQIAQIATSQTRHTCQQICGTNAKFYQTFDDQPDGAAADTKTFTDKSGNGNTCTAKDGANNTGMTAHGSQVLSYP